MHARVVEVCVFAQQTLSRHEGSDPSKSPIITKLVEGSSKCMEVITLLSTITFQDTGDRCLQSRIGSLSRPSPDSRSCLVSSGSLVTHKCPQAKSYLLVLHSILSSTEKTDPSKHNGQYHSNILYHQVRGSKIHHP